MTSHIRLGWLAATAMILAAASAQAQPRWGQDAMPRAGACFYQDSNFRGMYFCVRQGENLDRVPGGINDKVSSIRLIGNVDVVVFRDVRFRGESARFSTDVRNLQREGWNDLISSMRVSNSSWGRGGGGGGGGGGRSPVWGNDNMPREGACFFSEPEFRGQRFCVARGGSYPLLPPGFNDRISSVRIQRSQVMIFEDKDYDGRNMRLTSSVPDLGRTWSNRLSSLRVN
jgi:Beta/Gamma crystallin